MKTSRHFRKQELAAEVATQREQLRQQDIELQTKDQTIAQLEQERDEYKLAFDKLMQQRFPQPERTLHREPRPVASGLWRHGRSGRRGRGSGRGRGGTGADDPRTSASPAPQEARRKPARPSSPLRSHGEATAEEKTCPTHGERTLLPESMWDTTETLEFGRPSLKVRVTKYPKYACENEPECGIASPERPPGIVEGNKYAPSVAAEIITGKYSYHLPLYRQQDYFGGCGWVPSRSTQCNILANTFEIVEPLLKFFKTYAANGRHRRLRRHGRDAVVPEDASSTFDLSDPKQRRMQEVFQEALDKKQPSINAKMWAYRGTERQAECVRLHGQSPPRRSGVVLCGLRRNVAGRLLAWIRGDRRLFAGAHRARGVQRACAAEVRGLDAYPDERKLWLRWYQQLYDIEDRGRALVAGRSLGLASERSQTDLGYDGDLAGGSEAADDAT